MRAGVNIELPEPDCYLHLVELVRDGVLAGVASSTSSSRRCCSGSSGSDCSTIRTSIPDEAERVVGSDAQSRRWRCRRRARRSRCSRTTANVLPLDLARAEDDRRHRTERRSQPARRLQRRAARTTSRCSTASRRASASARRSLQRRLQDHDRRVVERGRGHRRAIRRKTAGRSPRRCEVAQAGGRHRARDRRQRADVARGVVAASTWAIARAST